MWPFPIELYSRKSSPVTVPMKKDPKKVRKNFPTHDKNPTALNVAVLYGAYASTDLKKIR